MINKNHNKYTEAPVLDLEQASTQVDNLKNIHIAVYLGDALRRDDGSKDFTVDQIIQQSGWISVYRDTRQACVRVISCN